MLIAQIGTTHARQYSSLQNGFERSLNSLVFTQDHGTHPKNISENKIKLLAP